MLEWGHTTSGATEAALAAVYTSADTQVISPSATYGADLVAVMRASGITTPFVAKLNNLDGNAFRTTVVDYAVNQSGIYAVLPTRPDGPKSLETVTRYVDVYGGLPAPYYLNAYPAIEGSAPVPEVR